MNEPKFTKGPWSWKDNRLFDKDGIMFGMVAYILNVANEIDANMAIIAAAPEMYGLLEAIAEQRVTGLSMYAAINNVLRKARGETTNEQ